MCLAEKRHGDIKHCLQTIGIYINYLIGLDLITLATGLKFGINAPLTLQLFYKDSP